MYDSFTVRQAYLSFIYSGDYTLNGLEGQPDGTEGPGRGTSQIDWKTGPMEPTGQGVVRTLVIGNRPRLGELRTAGW